MVATLHDDVLESLGHLIVSGQLRPGDTLTLEWIESEFGVSRTVARDCVRTLESISLVESRRRVGITVLPTTSWSALSPMVIRWQLDAEPRGPKLGALTEMRAAIEPVAAAAAARRATEEERSRILALAAILRRQGEAAEIDDFLITDIEFHSTILAASHNDTFRALTDLVAEVLSGRKRLGLYPERPKSVALDLHDHVAHCIATGDADGAEESMRALVAEVREALLARGLRGFMDA